MTEWVPIASAAIAAAGLAYTGTQFRLFTLDRRKERSLGIEGVCVSWQPELTPRPTEVAKDGTATWKYVISVYNPGRFPISQVRVELVLPLPARRVRGDHTDPAARVLRLQQPVIAGGATRSWNRYIRMRYDAASGRLEDTSATVEFVDSEGVEHCNEWPRTRKATGLS